MYYAMTRTCVPDGRLDGRRECRRKLARVPVRMGRLVRAKMAGVNFTPGAVDGRSGRHSGTLEQVDDARMRS